jgi:superfamily I DNA/RNA helicase
MPGLLQRRADNDTMTRLTRQQHELVTTKEPNVLCLASAGSGKSTTLVYRIHHLISNRGIDAGKIRLYSFSRTATSEIREKLEGLLHPHDFSRLEVSTFHAYAYHLLLRNAQTIGIETSKMGLWNDNQLEGLIKHTGHRMMAQGAIESEPSASRLESILANYRSFRHENQLPHHISPDDQRILTSVVSYMNDTVVYTYADLLSLTIRIFTQHPEILKKEQSSLTHLILDEAQDTQGEVFTILALLLNDQHEFTAVGDIQQNLYGFTGADPDNLIQYSKMRNCTIMQLNQTFRFGKTIADVANRVVADLAIEDRYKIKTRTEKQSMNVRYMKIDPYSASRAVIKTIRGWYEQGSEYTQMFVLARTNRELLAHAKALITEQIPFVNRGVSFSSRKEIQHILSAINIVNANRREDWIEFVKPYRVGIDTTMVTNAFEALGHGTIRQLRALIEGVKIPKIGPKRQAEFLELIDILLSLEQLVSQNCHDMRQFAHEMKITDCEYMITASSSEDGIDVIQERWEYIDLLTDLARQNEDSVSTLPAFIQTAFDIQPANQANAVTLMTIHRAKGMNLPFVILDTKKFFSFSTDEKEIQWEKFALYVGITRAEKQLVYLVDPANTKTHYLTTEVKRNLIDSDERGYQASHGGGDLFSQVAQLASGRAKDYPIRVKKVISASEKAMQLEVHSRKLWFPKSSIAVDRTTKQIYCAYWIAQQHGL